MKLKGKKVTAPEPRPFTIHRWPEPLELVAQAVLDFSTFDDLCPRPKPPLKKNLKTGLETKDYLAPSYQKAYQVYEETRIEWLLATSLMATPDLEYEFFKPNDPSTWIDFRNKELADFTKAEKSEIVNHVMAVNAPSQGSFEEAHALFTLSQNRQPDTTSHQPSLTEEQSGTQSGDLANDSESDPQESPKAGTN